MNRSLSTSFRSLVIAVVLAAPALAQDLTQFVNGTAADANQVNANFNNLKTAVIAANGQATAANTAAGTAQAAATAAATAAAGAQQTATQANTTATQAQTTATAVQQTVGTFSSFVTSLQLLVSVVSGRLDVRGDVKLGANAELQAVAGEEKLRILRGRINLNGTIATGSFFTCNRTGPGTYVITFNTAFSGEPTMTCTEYRTSGGTDNFCQITSLSNTSVIVVFHTLPTPPLPQDTEFNFICVGPR